MIDVRLIGLIPPTQAIPQPPSAQAVTTQGAGNLAQFPTGSVLSGYIINRDPGGNPILRTESGDILFASNLFLKIGSEVVIRILTSGGQQHAHIVSVNGQPPDAAESTAVQEPDVIVSGKPQVQAGEPQTNASTQKAGAVAGAALTAGQTISAIVVTPAPGANVSPGTSLLLSVLGLQQPASQPAPANSPLAQLTPLPPAPPSSSAAALASLLPPATVAGDAAPVAAQPTATPVPTAAQAAPSALSNLQAADADLPGPLGQSFTATAAQAAKDGSILFQSPLGTLRAANLGALPPGQPVALRVTSVASPNSYTVALANETQPLPPAPLTVLSRTWSSLSQIVQLLGADASRPLIPNFTPAGTQAAVPQAGGQILFFISALKGGSLRDWLGGGNVRALEEKGYGSLLKKAEGEFMQIARQFAEPQPGNWQTLYFPVMAAGELQQARAFIKREKKKNEAGIPTGEEDTRFVVEMDLSQLGEMQMDGLVKRREALQFDLIIRSNSALPREVEADIRDIYASTAELTGYHGQLVFQPGPFPVHPIEDITPHVFDDVVV